MRQRAFHQTPWLLLLLVAAAACVGGQTGDGEPADDNDRGFGDSNGGPTGSEGGAGCEYDTEVVEDLDASGELGFSPREAIERLVGSYETTLAWQSSQQLQLSPEGGVSALTIDLAHGGREVRIRRQAAQEPGGGDGDTGGEGEGPLPVGDIGFECPSAYEIDVELSFRTEGGAFDETFETMLVATAADVATFRHPIDHEALDGSFDVLGTQPPGGVVKQVFIGGTLSPLGTYGSVDGVLEYTVEGDGPEGGAVSNVAVGGGGLLASWPAESACDRSFGPGLSIALDADLGGHSASDAVDQANALFPRALSWQVPVETQGEADPAEPPPDPDAEGNERPDPAAFAPMFEEVSQTSVSLAVEATGDACARLEGNGWRLGLPVRVQASSDDGQWQSEYAGELMADAGAAGLSAVEVRAVLDNVPVAAFEATAGVSGIELEGYDYGRLQLEVDVDGASGSVEIVGAAVADCVNNPPEPILDEDGNIVGSAGCRGTDFITLRRGVF